MDCLTAERQESLVRWQRHITAVRYQQGIAVHAACSMLPCTFRCAAASIGCSAASMGCVAASMGV